MGKLFFTSTTPTGSDPVSKAITELVLSQLKMDLCHPELYLLLSSHPQPHLDPLWTDLNKVLRGVWSKLFFLDN